MADFDIEKIARLARIQIREDEQDEITENFERILSFVEQVQEVATDEDASSRIGAVHNVFREDEPPAGGPHEKGLYTDALLAEAPATEKGYIKVKKIL